MTGRVEKPEHVSRKRALVSCDRCKLRRARCVRTRLDEACADCVASGLTCEQKLPRKQRIYGSVESLSLRFRALECLVKGLFPGEDISDTDTLFKIAASRQIEMPANDDYTRADIFSQSSQQQANLTPQTAGSDAPAEKAAPAPVPTTTSGTTDSSPNPFLDRPPPPQPSEKLIPTLHGVPHYFGPSSSFKLAITIRTMVARCNALPEARSILRHASSWQPDSSSATAARTAQTPLRPTESQLSDEEVLDSRNPSPDDVHPSKRARRSIERAMEATSGARQDETVADFLPPKSVADSLVTAYFDRLHILMPLFHRSMFQFRFEQSWGRNRALQREKEETGWLCCLALVIVFGAQALENHDPDRAKQLQKRYLGFVRSKFRELSTTTSLVNIQALMLLQFYDHNAGKRSNAFVLIGTIARMAISMGMHREGSNAEFDPIERHTRRLVWWSLHTFEKVLSLILGRPSCIDDNEVSTRIPDENMLENMEVPPDFLEKSLDLAKLSYQVRRRAYWTVEVIGDPTPPVTTAKTLLGELDDWQGRLPGHLEVDYPHFPKQRRAVLMLHVYLLYTRCIVTRNYLIQKIERNIRRLENKQYPPQDDPFNAQMAALSEDCIVSAIKSLQCLNIVAEIGSINGESWFDVFYVFHAVLLICADFLARPANRVDTTEDVQRKDLVRAILRSTGAVKLAPTYNILSQIAFQFASITGATDEPYPSRRTTAESSMVPPTPQPPSISGDGMPRGIIEISNPDHDHDWYENEAANIPWWDFFDIANHGGASAMNTYYAAYPVGSVEPGSATCEIDDWTARAMRGVQNA
ncbi:hypothetical protein K491DRAFT_693763 [Lophiostoma macrostomum CBS 122681]|uniref:Zn(2)-C6 fungal-type domain-containing protein n=1 Tax=Lophiostoma macrostomum CBS 122681 TaxID=1314788 RepID=A0A6A6T5X0_9PLEO|nr:hypothetical protein K491DRAFT_693763 [Lophiostoma macrostomum CBS 122681]